jgi:hypothetical protein
MPRKNLERIPTAPLREYTAVPITDPAEIAQLEAKLKAYQEGGPVRSHEADSRSQPSAAADLLELVRQLTPQARLHVVKDLAAQLSAEEQAELLDHLQERLRDAADLPALRKAKRAEGKKPSIPLANVKREMLRER